MAKETDQSQIIAASLFVFTLVTLRSQGLRLQGAMLQKQFVKHTGKLGAERKLVERAGAIQQFQFDEATERSKQVIRLTVDGWVGGRVNAAFW